MYLQQTVLLQASCGEVKVKYTSSLLSREIKAVFLIASVRWQNCLNKSDVIH
jgi:hypothetical protein